MNSNNYDYFSQHYDEIMGDQKERAAMLQKIVKSYTPHAESILELACGTGTILKQLERDYTVAGIEYSQGMYEKAKAKLPDALILHDDMRTFSLSDHYDAVLCVFDSINHLLRIEEWEQTFIQAYKHLREGGIFILDMNTEYCLQKKVEEPAWVKVFAEKKLTMKVKEDIGAVVDWHVQINNISTGALLYEEHIPEISFPVHKVQQVLEKYFNSVHAFDLEMQPISSTTTRVLFVCRK